MCIGTRSVFVRTAWLTGASRVRHGSEGEKTLETGSRKHGIFRVAKFGIASGIGFLVTEVILALGVIASYHTIEVPNLSHSSLTILGLDALAFGVGVTVAFEINERVTVKLHSQDGPRGHTAWLARWGKYQLASLLGNLVIVAVQLALLATVSLSPVLGSLAGAIVSYPITYAVSMHFVWGIHPLHSGPGG